MLHCEVLFVVVGLLGPWLGMELIVTILFGIFGQMSE